MPVPKAQMMGKQDWRYVSGGAQSVVRGAHPPDCDITSLAFSRDNITLLSRAADDSLKVTVLLCGSLSIDQQHEGQCVTSEQTP